MGQSQRDSNEIMSRPIVYWPPHQLPVPHYSNPELPGEAIDDKNAILDILARDSRGRRINIEMQAHVTVRAMLKKGYPFNEISGITGLTVQGFET